MMGNKSRTSVDQAESGRAPWTPPHNKQLQRTATCRCGDVASAPFHYALALRFTRQRAAAELRRYAAGGRLMALLTLQWQT